MKISSDEILPPDVLLYVGTQNISFFPILGGVLDQNVLFSTSDLENYCQGHTFSRSTKYQKRVVSEKLKILSYQSHVQIGRLVWAVGRSKKKKKTISSFNAKSYFVATIFRYRGILIHEPLRASW
jgi:hypothetical protein